MATNRKSSALQKEDKEECIYDLDNDSKIFVSKGTKLRFCPSQCQVRYNVVHKLLLAFDQHAIYIKKIADIGCGDLKFLRNSILKLPAVQSVVCMDKDLNYLIREKQVWQQVNLDRRPLNLLVTLLQGDILDLPLPACLVGTDAITLIEVVEHLKVHEVGMMLMRIFQFLQPKVVVMSTPNTDFNIDFPLNQKFRHPDHKFELSSNEFQRLCYGITGLYKNYHVTFAGCGLGRKKRYITQIALFVRTDIVSDDLTVHSDAPCAFKEIISLCQASNAMAVKTKNQKKSPILNKLRSKKAKLKQAKDHSDPYNNYIVASLLNQLRKTYKIVPKCTADEGDGITERSVDDRTYPPINSPFEAFFCSKMKLSVQEICFHNTKALFRDRIMMNTQDLFFCLSPRNGNYSLDTKISKSSFEYDYDLKNYAYEEKLNITPTEAEVTNMSWPKINNGSDKKKQSVNPDELCNQLCTEDVPHRDCPFLHYDLLEVDSDDLAHVNVEEKKKHTVINGPHVVAIPLNYVLQYLNFDDANVMRDIFLNSTSSYDHKAIWISGIEYFSQYHESADDASQLSEEEATNDAYRNE